MIRIRLICLMNECMNICCSEVQFLSSLTDESDIFEEMAIIFLLSQTNLFYLCVNEI